jgi:hypothetical protein
VYRSIAVTFDSLIALAEARLGSRDAVLQALNNVSRQRLQSAMAGGPPLRPERLLSLALAADLDPIEALRAGGRAQLADGWEQFQRPRGEDITAEQRALLRDFELLPEGHQAIVRQLTRGLLAGKPDLQAAPRRRKGKTHTT